MGNEVNEGNDGPEIDIVWLKNPKKFTYLRETIVTDPYPKRRIKSTNKDFKDILIGYEWFVKSLVLGVTIAGSGG
jgi:hypothetical protein